MNIRSFWVVSNFGFVFAYPAANGEVFSTVAHTRDRDSSQSSESKFVTAVQEPSV